MKRWDFLTSERGFFAPGSWKRAHAAPGCRGRSACTDKSGDSSCRAAIFPWERDARTPQPGRPEGSRGGAASAHAPQECKWAAHTLLKGRLFLGPLKFCICSGGKPPRQSASFLLEHLMLECWSVMSSKPGETELQNPEEPAADAVEPTWRIVGSACLRAT